MREEKGAQRGREGGGQIMPGLGGHGEDFAFTMRTGETQEVRLFIKV